MNLIKVKFLRDGAAAGRAYTYGCNDAVAVGDCVQINAESIGEVVEIDVPEESINAFGADKLKYVLGKIEHPATTDKLAIVVNTQPGTVSINIDQIKAVVAARVKDYETMVYTDDSIAAAKKDRAYLRSQAKLIDDRRKEAKKEFMKPYDDFEAQVKEVIALIDKPIGIIDAQIKAYEAKVSDEKEAAIKKQYEECVPESLREYMPLDKIRRPTWSNVSVSVKSIRVDIIETQVKVSADIDYIKSSANDKTDIPLALAVYKDRGNLYDALNCIRDREKVRAEIAAQMARQAEEKEAKAAELQQVIQDISPSVAAAASYGPAVIDDIPDFNSAAQMGFDALLAVDTAPVDDSCAVYKVTVHQADAAAIKKFEGTMQLFDYEFERMG